MMQLVPKWRVDVKKHDGSVLVFWVYASSAAEVLRKVADMQFDENGLRQPQAITVVGVSLP